MQWVSKFRHNRCSDHTALPPPPSWTPAPETSYPHGLFNEAPEEECDLASEFCTTFPPESPRLLPSSEIERIAIEKCTAWGLLHPSDRFVGHVQNQRKMPDGTGVVTNVVTTLDCKDCCLISNLPLMAGQYHIPRDGGVYYEVTIQKMEGVIAIGSLHISLLMPF